MADETPADKIKAATSRSSKGSEDTAAEEKADTRSLDKHDVSELEAELNRRSELGQAYDPADNDGSTVQTASAADIEKEIQAQGGWSE